MELDSDCSGGIEQTVATRPGVTYELTYAYSPRLNRAADENQLSVRWNGVQVDYREATGGTENSWATFTVEVVAAGPSSLLSFHLLRVGRRAAPEPRRGGHGRLNAPIVGLAALCR